MILSAVTVVIVGAATVAVVREPEPQRHFAAEGLVLPGLLDHAGDIASIVLKSNGQTLTLQRDGGAWTLLERNHYPVRSQQVRTLVLQLANLQETEAKTADPALYARVGVEDPEKAQSKARLVEFLDSTGKPIAELLVGNSAGGFGATATTFVRKPDKPQVWLAQGDLTLNVDPHDWVERTLTKIPANDVRQVEVTHADGSKVTAVRDGSDEKPNFRILQLPKKEKSDQSIGVEAAAEMAGSLANLELDDLRPVSEFDGLPSETVVFSLTDGNTVAFQIINKQEERWIHFHDDALPKGLPAAAKGMAFRVPTFRVAALERTLKDITATPSGS